MTVNELAESIERLHEKFELIGDCDFLDIITMVRQQKSEIDSLKDKYISALEEIRTLKGEKNDC